MRTREEIDKELEILWAYKDALMANDKEEMKRLFPLVKFEAESLKAAKKTFGAEYVRRRGYNTEKADKKYGPGWLDRED